MTQATNTNSTLTYPGGQNKTSTAISVNILITVRSPTGNIPVGAIQTLSVSETRNIKMINEISTDGSIDSTPDSSTVITGSCDRIRFDRLRITEAFGRGFLHVASQAYPFDIVIFDKQKLAQGSQISTVIKNVWIKSLDYSYSSSDWVIMDRMTWQAEKIFSILNNGSSTPAAQGGEIAIPFSNIPVERAADTSIQGGSLSATSILDLDQTATLY